MLPVLKLKSDARILLDFSWFRFGLLVIEKLKIEIGNNSLTQVAGFFIIAARHTRFVFKGGPIKSKM